MFNKYKWHGISWRGSGMTLLLAYKYCWLDSQWWLMDSIAICIGSTIYVNFKGIATNALDCDVFSVHVRECDLFAIGVWDCEFYGNLSERNFCNPNRLQTNFRNPDRLQTNFHNPNRLQMNFCNFNWLQTPCYRLQSNVFHPWKWPALETRIESWY